MILLSSATRKFRGYFLARLRSNDAVFLVEARLVGELCTWGRVFLRDEEDGNKGVIALGADVGSGVLAVAGEALVCGVRRRSRDLVSRPRWESIGGRSRDDRGVGVPVGEEVLLCDSDGVIGTLSSNSVPLRGP